MSADPLISQTIGNYEILGRIGRGGMATVYRARQLNMQRDVAIKVMSAELADNPQFIARFEREAQMIANLQHPRILPVHDFGHSGEIFYLVMRLIEGESLYQRLQRGPLPLVTAGKYLDQMAEALDYAHTQGVVHRDLKPNNILIDQWDNLYLMDFGLAKLLAESQSLTQTGTVLGTPAYMSPEQWRGEPVDARTDVYSLGVILYEMVVGHTPFESDTPFTLMYKHLNDAPPPPRDTLPDLPEEIEQVILKALSKSKEDRYQSAGELAHAFGALVRVSGSLALKRRPPAAPPSEQPAVQGGTAPAAQQAIPIAVPQAAPAAPLSPEPAAAQESLAERATVPPVNAQPAPDVKASPAAEPSQPAAGAAPAAAAPAAPVQAAPIQAVPVPTPSELKPPAVPPPPRIAPPPPPIPVPSRRAAGGQTAAEGQAFPGGKPKRSSEPGVQLPEGVPPGVRDFVGRMTSSAVLQQAMQAVDQSLDMAFEKAADALSGPSSSQMKLTTKRGVEPVVPDRAPAFDEMRSLLPPEEALVGVLDVRGTAQWKMWKQLLVGGLALNLFSGLLGLGVLGAAGWLLWIFLIIQSVRTWRGDIGRYYLGFTSERVILLPHSAGGRPSSREAIAAGWSVIERLRLTGHYALIDMPTGVADSTVHFGGLLLAQGEGGLDDQRFWLPESDIPDLITEQGFETRNL